MLFRSPAGNPLVNVLGSELEACRIDIMQGRASEVLPEVEQRIAKVESWWRRKAGETVPEAPDVEYLGRVLIGALDIAMTAHVAQQDWNAALARIDRILEIKRELHRPVYDIANTRMNRANVLTRLRRYSEAQAELEACLEIFAGDPTRTAKVLNSLGDLFDDQGDALQAVELGRRALAMRQQLPDPVDRVSSHHNLAIYLAKIGTPSALTESACHQLAALAYRVVTGLGADTSIRNYAIDFRRAKAAGTAFTPPRLAGLLAQPAFRPLAQWLDQRGVNREELQSTLDQYLEVAREASES